MQYPDYFPEQLLLPFKPALGADYDKYRNHMYRVFLNCLLFDSSPVNKEKYAIAAVFHDIGIWTNHTIDYLAPSVEQAKEYLHKTGKQLWLDEIMLMINWHHKISSYHGPHQALVENFRKADWIDVSFGIVHFGKDKKEIRMNRKKIPNLGFHFFLLKKILQNFTRHPLNPLPMFRK
jgi:hypothetical protein